MTDPSITVISLARLSLRCVWTHPKLWIFALPIMLFFLILFSPVMKSVRESPEALAAEQAARTPAPAAGVAPVVQDGSPTVRDKLLAQAQYIAGIFLSAVALLAAFQALSGEPIRLGACVHDALRRWRSIAAFAGIMALVNLTVYLVPAKGPWTAIAEISAWVLFFLTYLALPILLKQRRGGLEAIRHDLKLTRATWWQRIKLMATLVVATFFFFVFLLVVFLLVAGAILLLIPEGTKPPDWSVQAARWAVLGILLVPAGFFYVLDQVATAALYTCAVEGVPPEQVDRALLERSWRAIPERT